MTVPASLEELIAGWKGFAVVSSRDADTGAWFFIALHDRRRGIPTGGTRLRRYERPAEGLLDAMRLAEGMTYKWAAVGLAAGGGKGVICLTAPLAEEERPGLFQRYGALIEGLRGGFATGRDLGTTDRDMLAIARSTAAVHGVDRESGRCEDPGPYTAHGVAVAMTAAVAHALGGAGLTGRRVLIQGIGAAGEPLARRLAKAGAELVLSDTERDKLQRLAAELDAETVAPEAVYDTPCDVYAPCAIGATLNAETIPRLRCRVVAGSANNQFATEDDAGRLLERGIVFAPDYLANGGGALAFGLMAAGETNGARIRARIEQLGETMRLVLVEAGRRGESPAVTMRRQVAALLRAPVNPR